MNIVKGTYIHEFSKTHEPVAYVKPGERVKFEAIDCYSGNLQSEEDLMSDFPDMIPNPATGPIFVEGIDKGDLLEVTINKITINDYGIMPTRPNKGLLGEYIEKEETMVLPIHEEKVTLNEITFPVNKMIGVIGVAPETGEVPNTTPGNHGGNMDTIDITEGNTLYLPVFHPGGLLALGDLHAAMGDGELDGSGVEVGGTVTLEVNKVKDYTLNMPIVKTNEEIIVIASDVEFHDAVKKVMLEGIRLIREKSEISFPDAYRLVSAKGDLRISQLVNPEVTVRLGLPKDWIAL